MTRALLLVLALLAAGCAAPADRADELVGVTQVRPAKTGRRLVLVPPKVRPADWKWPAHVRELARKGGPIGPAIRRELDQLGITVAGVYTPPSSGGVSNPMTEDLDAGGYDLLNAGVVALGGSSSTYPALRYGGSAGLLELLRADGSAGVVGVKGTHANGFYFESDDGATNGECKDSGFRWSTDDGDTEVAGQSETLNLFAKAQVDVGVNGSTIYSVDANGISLDSGKAITNALCVVKVRRAAAQTMTDGGNTDISWDTEQLDTGGVSTVGAGASTTVLTTGASGEVYYVTANVGLVSAASVPSISIKLIDTDGTTPVQRGVLWFPSGATSTIFQATAVIVSTAANQTIRVHFGHDSAASINTSESISGDVSCTAVRVR